jgi:hypothetical protein
MFGLLSILMLFWWLGNISDSVCIISRKIIGCLTILDSP